MPSRFKAIIQYVLIFGATIFLIWFSLRGLHVGEGEDKLGYLLKTWKNANKGWLLLMAGVAMISHLIRAVRWKMLMIPAGHTTKLSYSFLSLMIGYLVNLVIPRGGEVSRCYNLYKLDKTPVEISFGTVVVERIVDLLCLMILILIAFFMESEKLFAFINTLPWDSVNPNAKIHALLYLLLGIGVLGIGFFFLVRRNKKLKDFVFKTWRGFKEGLLSVFKLERKGLFIFYSLLIWSLYFLMSYMVILAFEETNHLGFSAVLSIFAIGSIAMAAPLPGGTGSYHVLVPQGLVFLYAIPLNDAVAFTFIFHGWQTVIMIVAGAISLLVSSFLIKRKSSKAKSLVQ